MRANEREYKTKVTNLVLHQCDRSAGETTVEHVPQPRARIHKCEQSQSSRGEREPDRGTAATVAGDL